MTQLNMELLCHRCIQCMTTVSILSQYFIYIICTNIHILKQKLTVSTLSYFDRLNYFVQMYVEILMWNLDQINSTTIGVCSFFFCQFNTHTIVKMLLKSDLELK